MAKESMGITVKKENFSEWYTQAIQKSNKEKQKEHNNSNTESDNLL